MQSESERIIDLYQRHALQFNQERSRSLFEKAWLDRFLALNPHGASVLDLGCGMGEPIAKYLIEQGCTITGVDTSSTFIDLCKNRFPDQNWLIADMRNVVLNERFQGILAWDSFFHLTYADHFLFLVNMRPQEQPYYLLAALHMVKQLANIKATRFTTPV